MNKSKLIRTGGVLLALIIIIRLNVLGALLVFLLLGIIPGTNYTIPTWILLPVFILSATFAIRWIIRQPSKIILNSAEDMILRRKARERVLKRTAAQDTKLFVRILRRYRKSPAVVKTV